MATTRFAELNYRNVDRGLWRIVDVSTGSDIGPHYRTREELLSDLERFADLFGCTFNPDTAPALNIGSVVEVHKRTIRGGYYLDNGQWCETYLPGGKWKVTHLDSNTTARVVCADGSLDNTTWYVSQKALRTVVELFV